MASFSARIRKSGIHERHSRPKFNLCWHNLGHRLLHRIFSPYSFKIEGTLISRRPQEMSSINIITPICSNDRRLRHPNRRIQSASDGLVKSDAQGFSVASIKHVTINAVLIDDAAADSSAFAVWLCIVPMTLIAIGEEASIVAVESPAWRYGIVPARDCFQSGRLGGEADGIE